MTIQLRINGRAHRHDGDEDMPLLWFLRDIAGLLGTKYGCGRALCGACVVHIDGHAHRACVTPMKAVADRHVTTIEGLSEDGDHPVQRAWREERVPQCGYCQSGQIMTAAALLAAVPRPTDAQVDASMAGNICRCGTYPRIRTAIHRAADLAGDAGGEGDDD